MEYAAGHREIFEKGPAECYRNTYKAVVCGYTESGQPIVYSAPGAWDVKSIVKSGDADSFEQYGEAGFVRLLKLMEDRSELPHHVVSQFIAIIDFEGYSMTQLASMGGKGHGPLKCLKN